MVYGFGFITMMFLGFLSGFCIGKVVLEWDLEKSLILSVVIGTFTLLLETSLLVIRLYQTDINRQEKEKRQKKDSLQMQKEIIMNDIDRFRAERTQGSLTQSN